MRFVSWNVNGLRAIAAKGDLHRFFEEIDADFFCLQETKMQQGQGELEFLGYQSYWNFAEKKGYSGTAIYCKQTPLNVTYGIGIPEHDTEGRVVTLEMPEFYLVCCYTPNSQDGLRRLDYRMLWEDAFREYLCGLVKGEVPCCDGGSSACGFRECAPKPVILCGDLNVAHEEIDLKNPATNHFNAGFSDQERGKMTELLGAGFVDSFRYLHPDARDAYSWWSYRMAARSRNVGWRIDYFIVSDSLAPRITAATIHSDIMGSDHCPVSLDLDL